MIVLASVTPQLLRLSDELLLVLAKHLDTSALNSLIQANRRLATILNPSLKAAAVLHGVNGQDALIVAARHGSMALARFALDQGAKTTATDEYGQTPLHWAAISGRKSIVQLLLENGADPDARCSSPGGGVKPLYCAVRNDHYQAVDVFLSFQYGALITSAGKDINGGTILHWAAIHSPHILQRLVESARLYRDVGLDINVLDKNGEAPIHWAARAGQYRTIRALLGVGARVELFNSAGKIPLHVVFEGTPHEKTVESLLKAGTKINTVSPSCETALHMAVRSESCPPSVIIYMVEHGAKTSAVTESGQTALHLAAIRGNELISWYLIDNRVDINATDIQGKTALHCAVDLDIGFWRNPIVNLLLEKGASVKIQDKHGETAIQAAIRPDSKLQEWERVKMLEVYPQLERAATIVYEEHAYSPKEITKRAYQIELGEIEEKDRAYSLKGRTNPWAVFEPERKQKTQLGLGSVKKLFNIREGFKLMGNSRGSRYRLARSQ